MTSSNEDDTKISDAEMQDIGGTLSSTRVEAEVNEEPGVTLAEAGAATSLLGRNLTQAVIARVGDSELSFSPPTPEQARAIAAEEKRKRKRKRSRRTAVTEV